MELNKEDLDDLRRTMNNLSSMPSYNGNLKKRQVDYWLENHSDSVMCRGHMRRIIFTPITQDWFKVTSAPM